MGTRWTSEKVSEYHKFMASFIAGYRNKIDCADLALEGDPREAATGGADGGRNAVREGVTPPRRQQQGPSGHFQGLFLAVEEGCLELPGDCGLLFAHREGREPV